MSWSEGRASHGQSHEDVLEKIEVVNKILAQLSKDENFQSDIKFDLCRTAIDHWTRKVVLPPEHANRLVENYRVVHVYKRFTELNAACKHAGMGVPVDHILQARDHLDPLVIKHCFGDEIYDLYKERHPDSAAVKQNTQSQSSAQATQMEQRHEGEDGAVAEATESTSDQSIDWKRLILSSLVETIVYAVIAYFMAYTVVKSGMINQFLDKEASEEVASAADDVVAELTPEYNADEF